MLRAISVPTNTRDDLLVTSQPANDLIPFRVYFRGPLLTPTIMNLVPWKTNSETLAFVWEGGSFGGII